METISTPKTSPLTLSFALQPREQDQVVWGCRAIFTRRYDRSNKLQIGIDIVHDRQNCKAREDVRNPEEEKATLIRFLNRKTKNWHKHLLKLVKEECLMPDEHREISFEMDGYLIRANPQKSFGYLYICVTKI